MEFDIYTAFPRGYCAGVERAVGMLMDILSAYPPPIYVNHEIIHNSFVVHMFERRGVIFESNLEHIPEGSLVVISAHGTGPSYFQALRSRNMRWIDTTCPLVEKVHREARQFIKEGYHILYIGKKGHQEALGVMDEAAGRFTLIEGVEDLEKITLYSLHTPPNLPLSGEESRNNKIALLTQTTLSVHDTEVIIKRAQELFPHIVLPKTGDICYATTNRQNAVKSLAEMCEVVLVVGSKNSSNSNKLRSVAESMGKGAYLIDDASEIKSEWFQSVSSVGVTAGASGPEELVSGVVARLGELGGSFVQELRVSEEKTEFPYVLRVES
ncbi:4-hydroxy-3-methylbut-2-enyl diphosphate reductase [Candidatus Gracilibacteria bacterium]|nr:4-hydroxy-3-methylbut-2-enyl diphosphate reductase [Candidatus Gracilibacteria bacterium]